MKNSKLSDLRLELSNWDSLKELLYLFLLLSFLFLRVYNISWMALGEIIPHFDDITVFTEHYIYPIILVILYIVDKFKTQNFNYKKIILDVIILATFSVTCFSTVNNIRCIAVGAFIICADFTSLKNIFKVSAIGIALPTLAVIYLSLHGWTGDTFIIGDRFDRVGYCFGFMHYAYWSRQLLFAALAYIFIRGKKISYIELITLTIISYIIFYYSTHRLGFYTNLIMICMTFVIVKHEWIKINNKLIEFLAIIAYPVGMLSSLLVSYFYNSDIGWMKVIDKATNGRLYLGQKAFEIFEINLFGQSVHNPTPGTYYFLDNGFLYILFSVGIIVTAVMLIMYSYTLWRACKTNNTLLFVVMMINLIYLMIDNPAYELTCFGVVLLTFPVVLKEHLKEKKLKQIV